MYRIIAAFYLLLAAAPGYAQIRTPPVSQASDWNQDERQPPPQQTEAQPIPTGRVATSSVGEAGQRQTREQTTGIEPMARVASRVQNRVQNRIQNRIDRTYKPQALATSPFAVAEDQTRTSGRRGR